MDKKINPPAWINRAMQLRKSWLSRPTPYAKVAKILRKEGFVDVTGPQIKKAIGA